MFLAIAVVCNMGLTECVPVIYPGLIQDESKCEQIVNEFITAKEEVGLYVAHTQCVNTGDSV